MVKTTKRFPIIKHKATFDKMLLDGDISDNVIQALIEDSSLIYSNGNVYSFIPPNGKLGQLLSYKSDGEYEWVNNLNDYNSIIDLISYGILWDNGTNDCIRIGNTQLHRELPILNKIKGVIAQGDTIMYYLNPNDWRFRKEPIYTDAILSGDINYDVILESDEFKNLRYEDQYVKIPVTIEYVTEPELPLESTLQVGEQNLVYHIYLINTDAGIAHAELQLLPYNWITETGQHTLQEYLDAGYSFKIKTGVNTIELGSCRNGYDGTVRQYIPQFYIRSWMDDEKSIVRISEVKVDETWTEQPESLLDAYCCTLLNTVPENMGYLSTLEVNSYISVYNLHDYCIGNRNKPEVEKHRKTHPFLTNYGKTFSSPDTATQTVDNLIPLLKLTKSLLMTLSDYLNIIYWLFAIEYNTLIFNKSFNNDLTSEGFKQGGHGNVPRPNSDGYVSLFNISLGVYNYFPLGLGDYNGNNTVLSKYPKFEYFEGSMSDLRHIRWDVYTSKITATTDNNVLAITAIKDNSSALCSLRSNPEDPASVHGNTTITITGLLEGLELTFCNTNTLETALTTVTLDGEYIIPYTYIETIQNRLVFSNFTAEECNIVITVIDRESVIIRRTTSSGVLPRWRGFDSLVTFGTIVDCLGIGRGDVIDIIDHEGNILLTGSFKGTWYSNLYNLGKSANILFTKNGNPEIQRFNIRPGAYKNAYMMVSCYFLRLLESDGRLIYSEGSSIRTITHLR